MDTDVVHLIVLNAKPPLPPCLLKYLSTNYGIQDRSEGLTRGGGLIQIIHGITTESSSLYRNGITGEGKENDGKEEEREGWKEREKTKKKGKWKRTKKGDKGSYGRED